MNTERSGFLTLSDCLAAGRNKAALVFAHCSCLKLYNDALGVLRTQRFLRPLWSLYTITQNQPDTVSLNSYNNVTNQLLQFQYTPLPDPGDLAKAVILLHGYLFEGFHPDVIGNQHQLLHTVIQQEYCLNDFVFRLY